MRQITQFNTMLFYLFLILTCSMPILAKQVVENKPKTSFDSVYNGKNYCVDKKSNVQIGNASYYASFFHGRHTASGEVCNIHTYTAAHRSLPFGTVLRVTMLDNAKSVLVKVNDRGPFIKSRVLDISPAAAKKIELTHLGVGKVKIEKLKNCSEAI